MRPFFYSLNEYIKDSYGCKLYKLALNGGMSCPNRDGLIDTRGCIFCSAGGSGDFTGDAVLKKSQPAAHRDILSVNEQIDAAKKLIEKKYRGSEYIAYFQSYTNTYADTDTLRGLYTPVICRPDIRILSIATRPDCLSSEVLGLLSELVQRKPVWVELGLQTIHECTARYIRRGYPLPVFEKAVRNLNAIGIQPIVHMIIGLPGETEEMMLQTAEYIAHSPVGGVKLQLLHVLKNTDLAGEYAHGAFTVMNQDDYFRILGRIIEILPRNMVIHRLTGDGPKNLLIAPQWSADKKNVMNTMNRYFKENNICQGRKYR